MRHSAAVALLLLSLVAASGASAFVGKRTGSIESPQGLMPVS